MGQGSEIAAGSHRAFFRNHRCHATIEHRDQTFNQYRTTAAEALCENVGAQKQQGARFGFRKRWAESAGVTTNEVELQLAKLRSFDANI